MFRKMMFKKILTTTYTFIAFFVLIGTSSAQEKALSTSEKVSTNGFSYSIEALPKWISTPRSSEKNTVHSYSVHYELIDDEIKVEQDNSTRFTHVIRAIDTSAGLDNGTHIEAVFDPSFQSLIVHQIEIIRGDKRINKLTEKIQLLQRETQLEAKMYDGLVTASIVLNDVRVGDKIEYAYSIVGVNPVFKGKFVYSDWALASLGPIDYYQFRLLMPESRAINIKVGSDFKVSTTKMGGLVETLITRKQLPQLNYDTSSPFKAYIGDQIYISEFLSWEDVAKWGVSLFNAQSSPEVKTEADLIKKSASNKQEQLLLALNFVQKEIRYLGMEIGANTHQPNSPRIVINQRFGDCKDKTLLLVTLLRELNIDAKPVLVSTNYRSGITELMPNPLVFNHVISKVDIDGQSVWLDATRSYQTGKLKERETYDIDKGLVLDTSTQTLATLPSFNNQERVTVEENFRIEQFSKDPIMKSRITYYGDLAENLRNSIATVPHDKIENFFTSEYVKYYPKIHPRKELTVEEVMDTNAITVVQEFDMPDFWQYPEERSLYAEVVYWNLLLTLVHPNESSRKLPFLIQSPGVYRQVVSFDLPEEVMKSQDATDFKDDNNIFSYQLDFKASPKHASFESVLKFSKDTISVAEWPTFSEKVLSIRNRFASSLTLPTISNAKLEQLNTNLTSLEQEIKSMRLKPMSQVQIKAKIQELALKAQLESGRLNSKFKANALNKLAIQQDIQGQQKLALTNFKEAINLSPNDPNIYAEAALNAFALGNDSVAKAYSNKVLELSPSNTDIYNTKAYAYYFSRDYVKAKESFLKYSKNTNQKGRGYAALWIYLSMLRNGEDAKANIKQYLPDDSLANDWTKSILDAMLDNNRYDDTLKLAKDDANPLSKLCELYFYMGEKYLIEGNNNRAREFFNKSIDTGIVEFNEYTMSKRNLALIDKH
jgi:lipoprotein NlpI/transglutaminase-like putative cysteine protease